MGVTGREPHSYSKQMTNNNITKTSTASVGRSPFNAVGLGIAAALTPFAVVIGIATMNVPAAEAQVTRCTQNSVTGSVTCRTTQF